MYSSLQGRQKKQSLDAFRFKFQLNFMSESIKGVVSKWGKKKKKRLIPSKQKSMRVTLFLAVWTKAYLYHVNIGLYSGYEKRNNF